MSIRENIIELRKRYNLTQDELAKIAGVTRGAVSQWEGGFSEPRMGSIQAIVDHFGLKKSNIIEDGGMSVSGSSIPSYAIPVKPSGTLVPLMGYTHMGEAVDEDTCERMVEVPTEVVERHPSGYCVHADGDCMDNRYPSDSVLYVDPDMEPMNGHAVLAELPNYQSVVRSYSRGSSTLMLSPDSHSGEYEDIIVRAGDEPVTLKGVVVWYQAERDVR